MDRLEAMSVVLAVAEAGSLSAAARLQKAPLTTLSRKVSELEAHLRTKLFNRSGRLLVPTYAGRSYIAASKLILADLAEAERAASGECKVPRGALSVTAPVFLGRTHLQPIIAEFLTTFPEIDVQLSLQDRNVSILKLGAQDRNVNLRDEDVDVALRIGAIADSSLIAVRIGEFRFVMCASPAYLKSRGSPKAPNDLSVHDCISNASVQSPTTWRFKRDQIEYVVPVRSRLVVSNTESACDAARSGIGIAMVFSYQVAKAIKSGELTPLLQDFMPPSQPISFVYSPDRFMTTKLRAFLDFALPRLQVCLGDLPRESKSRRVSRR